jgi:hypothetical protein
MSLKKINPREVLQIARGLQQVQLIKTLCKNSENDYLKRLGDSLNPCQYIADKIVKEIIDNPPIATSKGNVIAMGVDEALDDLRNIATHGKTYLLQEFLPCALGSIMFSVITWRLPICINQKCLRNGYANKHSQMPKDTLHLS